VFELIAYAALSAVLIYISRASLRASHSHGFYRFFALEFITALYILNIDVWFLDPFSWNQLVSWFLLIVYLIPLAFGIRSLRAQGKPVVQRDSEPQLLAFEKTSTLVTTGIYHYIRHPLCSSLLLLAWGDLFQRSHLAGCIAGAGSDLISGCHSQGRRSRMYLLLWPSLSSLGETHQDVRAILVLKCKHNKASLTES
jgi:protein-S-isoprenylcysteine O-methyltransferase Ste14